MAIRNYVAEEITSWQDLSLPSMSISGAQMGDNTHFDDYDIILELSFSNGDERQDYGFQYQTEEPYLNLIYYDTIGGFLF